MENVFLRFVFWELNVEVDSYINRRTKKIRTGCRRKKGVVDVEKVQSQCKSQYLKDDTEPFTIRNYMRHVDSNFVYPIAKIVT